MRKLGGIAVLVVALLLAGCSSSAPADEPSSDKAAPTVAAAPITQAPEASLEPTSTADEAQYLEVMKTVWQGNVPVDADLVAAGQLACDGLRAGNDPTNIVVVEGESEDAATNNGRLITAATQFLCPEFF